MVFFPPGFDLGGFPAATYQKYVSLQTLVSASGGPDEINPHLSMGNLVV